MRVLEEGTASAEDIDKGMRLGTGWPIGPLALIDLIGIDVHVHVCEALWSALPRAPVRAAAATRARWRRPAARPQERRGLLPLRQLTVDSGHRRESLVRRYDSTDVILILAPLMWSLHIVGSKYALGNGFLPMPFLIIRFVSAALVFTTIALFVERTLRIEGRSDQLYVAGAAVMFAVNQIAFVFALKATTAVTVSLVFGLFPITVGVLAAAIGHEAMTTQKAVAGIVSFVGVSLVVIGIPGGVSKLSGEIWGILIALCIPLSWAFFSLLIGPPMKRHTPMRINAVVLPGTAVAVTVVGFSSLGNQDYAEPDTLAWICLAYSALGTLVITNLLWFRVVGRVGAAKSSYFLNLQPFGAALLAWLLLGETITVIQVLGGIGIGAGIVISRVRVRTPTPLE